MLHSLRFLVLASVALAGPVARADERIQLATDAELSPDGKQLVFAYREGLWSASVAGGVARPVTMDDNNENAPKFSPDGKTIAFISDRSGSRQVYVMPAEGGTPRQLTHHTAGYSLKGWSPDGTQLLVSGTRDHFWRRGDRLFWIPLEGRSAEVPLFDDYGFDPSISPDGKKILFTREGEAWWRKGYSGSQASQIWMCNIEDKSFTRLLDPPGGARWPLWKADGKGFFYAGGQSGVLNLRSYDLASKTDDAITDYKDDAVVFPALSRDGKTLVFRRLFDMYRYTVGGGLPEKIELTCAPDRDVSPLLRRTFNTAGDLAPSKDGLELAFIAGGDVWVMDTELREPRPVTKSAEEERDVVFAPNGDAVWFVSDAGGQTDIWKAERSEKDKFWWQNSGYVLSKVTDDPQVEAQVRFSPDGGKVAFNKDLDLWVGEASGKDLKRFQQLRDTASFDWSPDGRWLCYATEDDDYNSDIWVAPLDGSRAPYNLSRHPDNDMNPRWSPDGKMIAFTGRRVENEVDVYLVHLSAKHFESNSRDRKLDEALEKMTKGRKSGRGAGAGRPGTPPMEPKAGEPKPADPKAMDPAKPAEPKSESPKTETDKPAAEKLVGPPAPVTIDFDGIHRRMRRISIPDSNEGGLLWSPDSKKLAFSASVDGKRGLYSIELPDNLKPNLLSATPGSSATWLSEGNQIVWLVSGVPTATVPGGKISNYAFSAPQEVDRAQRNRAAFDQCWRTMRDQFYDARLGNRNWDEVRRKYADAAAAAVDETHLATVVSLMLGELNGSHLGFMPASVRSGSDPDGLVVLANDATVDPLTLWSRSGEPDPEPAPPERPRSPSSWRPVTAHLGLRFDPQHKGPGLKVRDVIHGGPTSHQASLVKPGELVLSIDGVNVDPAYDLTQILNGRLDRDIRLTVRDDKGVERKVTVRPTSYEAIGRLLYDKWIEETRKRVDDLSKGTLGYLHIRAMNDPSFIQFDEDLYFAGAGKDGLIVDVRENGGGSIADHLLTAITQPVHAITLSRAGGPGYPQDRKIYATWNKPIIVLCNQNSFSNAEIFSHAVKTLKRGRLVGVPTAGGVISTGAARIMDMGTIRTPGRGWYLPENGEDMELNGARPDVILWPEPGEMPQGIDTQLSKAVELLTADVKTWKERPQPALKKASERTK